MNEGSILSHIGGLRVVCLGTSGIGVVGGFFVLSPYNLWIAFISSAPSLTSYTWLSSIVGAIRAEEDLEIFMMICIERFMMQLHPICGRPRAWPNS